MRDMSRTEMTEGGTPFTLHLGDCLVVMRTMPDSSVDAIVTDPPYELGFMGKSWDASGIAYSVDMWREAMRVLKPGGHLLAFSGSRTYHRMACAIEDAGFEIRDQIMWVYGSGFPKSLNVAKAIESGSGRPEDIRRMQMGDKYQASGRGRVNYDHGAASAMGGKAADWLPATDAARQWEGWGTALKPAHEPICVARKPLAKGATVAANVLQHGTGAINIDGCRVPHDEVLRAGTGNIPCRHDETVPRGCEGEASAARRYTENGVTNFAATPGPRGGDAAGRWPANLIHDGSDEVLALFPVTSSHDTRDNDTGRREMGNAVFGAFAHGTTPAGRGDSGSAARFFYCAKASRADRNEGLEGMPELPSLKMDSTSAMANDGNRGSGVAANFHPTVKPTDLMAYLVRLVTPPGGVVLDLFMGSGTTGKACMREGFKFIGIDKDEDENGQPLGYLDIARARIEHEWAIVTAAAEAAAIPATQRDLFEEAA